jgi:uncharacterized protein
LKPARVQPILRGMKRGFLLALLALLCGVAACRNSESSPAPVPPAEAPPSSRAQPRLPELILWLGPEELKTEIAMTQSQIQTGMMFRTGMAENEGMLFVFGAPHRAAFWMKNTSVPLSAAYIDPEGVILEIHDLHPHDTNSVQATTDQVQYVLEVNQGWFKRKNLGPGTVIRTELGTFRETFFEKRKP